MAPPKQKIREDDEDISQLRKPITLHGKPVEQILNSIHYGSPELRSLLLYECDMIFECKVCRALFRDLPNFIAHKRRYCSKSAAENNHFAIADIPDERIVIVHPQPVDDSETPKSSTQTESSRPSLEDSLQRIRSGERGKSCAFKVYSDAADKLRHQKENATITSIRTRDIPTNSNAVFVDVKMTPVNIHDRPSASSNDTSGGGKSGASIKTITSKAGEKTSKTSERTCLRSKSSNKANEKPEALTDILMRELKVIQNKVRNKGHTPQKADRNTPQGQSLRDAKTAAGIDGCQLKQKVIHHELVEEDDNEEPEEENSWVSKNADEAGLVEVARHSLRAAATKTEKVSEERQPRSSSKSSSDDGGVAVSKENLRKSRKSLICAKCGSIFSSGKSLRFHVKIHHSVNRTFYPCPQCSNLYYYLSAVTRHLEINHGKTHAETSAMRPELRTKAFTKPTPQSETVRVAKRTLMGTRRSSRYKETGSTKKGNNAPYVYSSMNRGKKLSAKNDIVLSERSDKDVKPTSLKALNKPVTPVGSKGEKIEEQRDVCKSNVDNSHLPNRHRLSTTREEPKSSRKVPSPVKRSSDIDTEMISCSKCSRLFGRRATYETHIKVCDGRSSSSALSASGSPTSVPAVSRRLRQSYDPSSKDEVDSGDIRANSSPRESSHHRVRQNSDKAVVQGSDSNDNGHSNNCVSQDTKPAHDKPSSPVKVDRAKQSPNVKDDRSDSPKRDESSQSGRIDTIDLHNALTDDSEWSFTVTRLKSKGVSDLSGVQSAASSLSVPGQNVRKTDATPTLPNASPKSHPVLEGVKKDPAVNREGLTRDSGSDKEVKVETKAGPSDPSTLIVERPRRKRKVPSRNIGAVEFLQKIHRLDRDEPAGKRVRDSSAGDDNTARGNKRPTSAEANKPISSNGGEERKGSVSRAKKNAKKVFVLNSNSAGLKLSKSKLHCYNHSSVQKFMDMKKMTCLKCGAKFSFLHNLKRHIVRLHLKWSRFQCKLCAFNSFDKSECNTHIIRHHRNGKKPDRNHYFNTLIIDLAKKGSKAMTDKKHETLRAKNQQQDSEKNIYKNQNAQRVPRLHERKLEASAPISSPQAEVSSEKQAGQKEAERKKGVPEKCLKGSSNNNNNPPPPSHTLERNKTVDVPPRSTHTHAPHSTHKISHLVVRTPRVSIPHLVHPGVSSTEKITKLPDKTTRLPDSVSSNNTPKVDKDLTHLINNKSSTLNTSNSTNTTNSSIKRVSLPFNISTRNSPRVFDTTPYNREAAAPDQQTSSTNDVVLQTRHGAYTKTIPVVAVTVTAKETPELESSPEPEETGVIVEAASTSSTAVCNEELKNENEEKAEIVLDKGDLNTSAVPADCGDDDNEVDIDMTGKQLGGDTSIVVSDNNQSHPEGSDDTDESSSKILSSCAIVENSSEPGVDEEMDVVEEDAAVVVIPTSS